MLATREEIMGFIGGFQVAPSGYVNVQLIDSARGYN